VVTPQLLDYIRQQFAAGVTKEGIQPALISQGWSEQDVKEAFMALEKAPPIPTPQVPTPPSTVPPIQPISVINKTAVVSNQPVKSIWGKGIPRTNWTFMVISLLLVFGLDLLILFSSPSLWPFWAEMLIVFVIFAIFFCLENYIFSKKFSDTKSHLDPWISGIIVARNLIFLLNFVPFIQILGMALVAGFLVLIPSALLGGGGGFGLGGLGGLGITALIMPGLLLAYIILIVFRFSAVKHQAVIK
jgi:hypothetical protein